MKTTIAALLLIASLPGMAATTKSKPLSFKEPVTVKKVVAKPLKATNLSSLFNGIKVSDNYRKPAVEVAKAI